MQAAGFSEVLRGVSHRILVEGSWGLSFDRPVAYLSEYLDALLPLLNERRVSVVGERVSAHSELDIDSPPCPVLIAALGPRMLELAGRATSGTITWMVGANTAAPTGTPGEVERTRACLAALVA